MRNTEKVTISVPLELEARLADLAAKQLVTPAILARWILEEELARADEIRAAPAPCPKGKTKENQGRETPSPKKPVK